MSSNTVGFAVRVRRDQFITIINRAQTQSKHTQNNGDQAGDLAGDRVADRAGDSVEICVAIKTLRFYILHCYR